MTADAAIVIRRVRRKGRSHDVELQTGENLRLPAETVLKYAIFAEARFAPERWLVILQEAWQLKAYERLLGLLARRPHTESEIRTKLFQRKFDRATVAHAMARAKAANLLDDAAFAKAFAEERLTIGAQGRHRISAELRHRGVARDLIEAAFENVAAQHGDDAEYDQAVALAQRKWSSLEHREPDRRKRQHKLLAFLASRGYAPDLCYRVVDTVAGSRTGA